MEFPSMQLRVRRFRTPRFLRHFVARFAQSITAKQSSQTLYKPVSLSCLAVIAFVTVTWLPSAIPLAAIVLLIALAVLATQLSSIISTLTSHPWFHNLSGRLTLRFSNLRWISAVLGAILFLGITIHAQVATAQLFNSAEQQANSIFGQYIDGSIITFLFGLLRIVVWVTAVGFVLFAVYQAQRGEQWQPLMQNAFIVVAAVVVVEGLSAMFFGGGSTTAAPTATPRR